MKRFSRTQLACLITSSLLVNQASQAAELEAILDVDNTIILNMIFDNEAAGGQWASIYQNGQFSFTQADPELTDLLPDGSWRYFWDTDIEYNESTNYRFKVQGNGNTLMWLPGPGEND